MQFDHVLCQTPARTANIIHDLLLSAAVTSENAKRSREKISERRSAGREIAHTNPHDRTKLFTCSFMLDRGALGKYPQCTECISTG